MENLLGDILPRLKLTVRIGVTGHRCKELEHDPELDASMSRMLQTIQDLADRTARRSPFAFLERAECRFLSPLAEGADRAGARVARHLNLPLECLLPFREDEYVKTFKGGSQSVAEFQVLKKESVSCLEMDGGGHENKKAFVALAEALIVNVDVLFAVWNGDKGEEGGTREVMIRALGSEIPVIWFDPAGHSEPRLIEKIEPELKTQSGNIILNLEDRFLRQFSFDTEREKAGSLWDRILFCLGRSDSEYAKAKDFCEEPLSESVEAPYRVQDGGWCALTSNLCNYSSHHRHITETFRSPFEWADRFAGFYAQRYRLSFRTSYILGASAVSLAFLGHYSPIKNWPFHPATWIELALIGFILLLTVTGGVARWHVRWLEYRWLAEVLRQRHFLAPISWIRPFFRAPAHLGSLGSRRRWVSVYFACLLRQAPLPSGQVDETYLAYCRATLQAFMGAQESYHSKRAKEQERVVRRLHYSAFTMFVGAVIGCVWHLKGGPELITGLMVIVLPAFASAISAILHHGEIEQQVKHSEALASWLKVARKDLDDTAHPSREVIEANATGLSDAMLNELVDWRDAFLDKPIPAGH